MENKINNIINYDYYAVAFIDVLGQSEAFKDRGIYIDSYKSPLLGNREELKKKLLEAHKNTADVVQNLRKTFDDFIKLSTSVKVPPAEISEDRIEQYKETVQPRINLHTFSDCILATTCLAGEKYYGSVLTSIHYIMVACEGTMLESLAIGKPFRAVIDVGMGTKLENGEIYGPVSARVYEAERNIAQYPRIVVGAELINFLINVKENPQIQGQDARDTAFCKKTAEGCLKRIKKDLDGIYILDYIGPEAKRELEKGVETDMLEKTYQMALKFVEHEYERYKAGQNQKLSQRYYMLKQYLVDNRP